MTSPVAVPVPVEGHPYEVLVGEGLLVESGERIRVLTQARRAAIITDANVAALYLQTVRESLARAGLETEDVVVPAGEGSKSWEMAGRVLEALARAGLDRTDAVVALGGGVVGDLAGFAAATYLRGVAFAQLPTTLLAQVDSSVGGKTGVDLIAGKNLAGAFKQPFVVLADTDTLATLPVSEWQSGLAEVAKVAVLDGDEMLDWLERSAAGLAARGSALAGEAVRRCVAFKARIVGEDECESGLRECLNYGHTLGHALEKVAGYGEIPHGVAVAEGIRFVSRLAVDAVGASPVFADRQGRLLDALGIPRVSGTFDADELRAAISSDKKARAGTPRFVLANAPGSWQVLAVAEDLLAKHLTEFAEGCRSTGPRGEESS